MAAQIGNPPGLHGYDAALFDNVGGLYAFT
jgi:hypothetical protein